MHSGILSLDVETDEDVVTIRCNGELDMTVAGELRSAIEGASRPNLKQITIDTTGLSFMDSSGLHCLIETKRRCEQHGTRLEVIPSRPVARLLRLVGVADDLVGPAGATEDTTSDDRR